MAFQDGTHPFGSVVITIGSIGYPTENWEITQASSTTDVRNNLGEISGWIAVAGFITAKATCQLATSTYPVPTLGSIFTLSSVTYVVLETGSPQSQMDITKVSLSVRKRVNA